jgi:hypothetical protein
VAFEMFEGLKQMVAAALATDGVKKQKAGAENALVP